MKIVINRCFGGFGLSPKAHAEYCKRTTGGELWAYSRVNGTGGTFSRLGLANNQEAKGYIKLVTRDLGLIVNEFPSDAYWYPTYNRSDPVLVSIVEELGEIANDELSRLKVVEIPDGVDWEIGEYDGMEHVEEVHRSWR